MSNHTRQNNYSNQLEQVTASTKKLKVNEQKCACLSYVLYFYLEAV